MSYAIRSKKRTSMYSVEILLGFLVWKIFKEAGTAAKMRHQRNLGITIVLVRLRIPALLYPMPEAMHGI